MYFVCVGGRPQSYNGYILAFCSYGVTLFPSREDAEEAAKETIGLAAERGLNWAIVTGGYQIFKVAAELTLEIGGKIT